MEIQHKGWDWDAVKSESWNEISEEFLPVALSWVRKYHSVLDIGTGKGRHTFFFAKNGFKASAIDLSCLLYTSEISLEIFLEISLVAAEEAVVPIMVR